MRNLIFTLSIGLFFLACATPEKATMPADKGSALNISQPPSGSLSDNQLKGIAEDIHRLNARPLASDAADARRNLFNWIQGSPDVSVSVCGGILGDLLGSKSSHSGELLMHYLLSSAAQKIELNNVNDLEVYHGGMKGAIESYKLIFGQKGGKAKDSFMESMIEKDNNGRLEDFIRQGLSSC